MAGKFLKPTKLEDGINVGAGNFQLNSKGGRCANNFSQQELSNLLIGRVLQFSKSDTISLS